MVNLLQWVCRWLKGRVLDHGSIGQWFKVRFLLSDSREPEHIYIYDPFIYLGCLILGQRDVDDFPELLEELGDQLDGGVERQVLDVDGARVFLLTFARHERFLATNLNQGSLKI